MITLINSMLGIEHVVKPTVFPDKTQQVWKLDESLLGADYYCITWEYENPGELLEVAQLVMLLRRYSTFATIELDIPFLPYGRQDKPVDNDQTFGLTAFCCLLKSLPIDTVYSTDIHGKHPKWIRNVRVTNQIDEAVESFVPSAFCYPDKGAETRYHRYLGNCSIVLDKDRDPLTGEIKGLKIETKPQRALPNERILIVDDICDGGRTFIEAAKLLHSVYPECTVGLYVTHGIFSKGTQVLYDAGIAEIYTRKGKVQ